MTAPRKRYLLEPATMTWSEVAEYAFRKSESWLRAHMDSLDDFPRPHPKWNVFLKRLVDKWLARQFGDDEAFSNDWESILSARAKGGARVGPISRRQAP